MRGAANALSLAALLAVAVLPLGAARAVAAPAVAVLGAEEAALSPDLVARQAGLVHLVQSDLCATTSAGVVSRQQTARFLDELGMAAADLVEPETAQRFGRAASADYLVFLHLGKGAAGPTASVAVQRVADGLEVWRGEASADDVPALAAEIAEALRRELGLAAVQPQPEKGRAPALAVLDFRSEGLPGPLDLRGSDLADLLCADLTTLEVPLVERVGLNAMLSELGLSAAGLVRQADMAKLGRLLGAERVLDTAMIATGDGVVFDSQVIQPETGLVVGTCRVTGEASRLPALVQQLATETAQTLQVPVTEEGRHALAEQATGSLEAALHGAAGWRLGQSGQAEEAAKEYQQAIYLDPKAAGWWLELGRQYQALDRMEDYAETMRRYFAAQKDTLDPEALSAVAGTLADAEIWCGHAAESEAAARLALQYHEDAGGYYLLLHALAEQTKYDEGRRFCEGLVGRKEVDHRQLVEAWDFLIGWFAGPTAADPHEDYTAKELSNIARALDLFPEGDAQADYQLPPNFTDGLLQATIGTATEPLRLDRGSSHLEDGLQLARRMAARSRDRAIASHGWFMVGVLEYKLHHPQEAVSALTRCLRDYPEQNFDTGHPAANADAANGVVHYALGRVYQDEMGDRERAVASYQRALLMLDPEREDAQEARARLAALNGSQSPRAPWVRRVGGLGQRLQTDGRCRAVNWLRGQGYDLRLPSSAPLPAHLAEEGVQVLTWEGRTSDFPPVEQLRAYVAGGGNLLICLGSQPAMSVIGPSLATTSGTMDLGLNWLLPAFGMEMEGRAVGADSAALTAAPGSWLRFSAPATYSGVWFPLRTPQEATSLLVRDGTPGVAVAGATVGLGKVVVVSLREWFMGADLYSEFAQWQADLLRSALGWFGQDDRPRRYAQAAAHWRAAREFIAAGAYGAAVQELDQVEAGAPSAADGRYWAACLLADSLGDADGAARRWQEVVVSRSADPWLARRARLRLGVLALRHGETMMAEASFAAAAGEERDELWGEAWVATGDARLAEGDFAGAAECFRMVADERGHSEERFRALYGLAYALGKQGRREAAVQVYQAVAVEFGKAALPADMDTRWPDPWRAYFPQEKRPEAPTVADAVAAGKALLGEAPPAAER